MQGQGQSRQHTSSWSSQPRPRRTLNRRRLFGETLVVTAAGLFVAACQSAPASPTAAPSSAATAVPAPTTIAAPTNAPPPTVPASSAQLKVMPTAPASAGAPKSGGTLTMAQKADVANFDPFYLVQNNAFIYQSLYDSLILYDEKMNPLPRLAESWDLAKDGKSIQLKLRKGVSFHSGREVESSDVAYSISYVQDPKHGSQIIDLFAPVTKVETPDKYTV
ncbi:MAG TPA: ABC transporter substrate-binding protein, partial [Chloroflexota bacterium]|nr:ABC transporter substrate-binding protein [Chloroflexota bacterium]